MAPVPNKKTLTPDEVRVAPYFFTLLSCAKICGEYLQASLLALGSSYYPRLPIHQRTMADSGISWISSPITAAGPHPFLTGFLFSLAINQGTCMSSIKFSPLL